MTAGEPGRQDRRGGRRRARRRSPWDSEGLKISGMRLLYAGLNFVLSGALFLAILAALLYLAGDERLWHLIIGWLQYLVDLLLRLIPSAPGR